MLTTITAGPLPGTPQHVKSHGRTWCASSRTHWANPPLCWTVSDCPRPAKAAAPSAPHTSVPHPAGNSNWKEWSFPVGHCLPALPSAAPPRPLRPGEGSVAVPVRGAYSWSCQNELVNPTCRQTLGGFDHSPGSSARSVTMCALTVAPRSFVVMASSSVTMISRRFAST